MKPNWRTSLMLLGGAPAAFFTFCLMKYEISQLIWISKLSHILTVQVIHGPLSRSQSLRSCETHKLNASPIPNGIKHGDSTHPRRRDFLLMTYSCEAFLHLVFTSRSGHKTSGVHQSVGSAKTVRLLIPVWPSYPNRSKLFSTHNPCHAYQVKFASHNTQILIFTKLDKY